MPSFTAGTSAAALPFKPKNKERRQAAYVKHKKAKESARRDMRMKRRREEDRDPTLRTARQGRNQPTTIEKKRVWDELDEATEGDGLGLSVDIASLKKRRLDHEALPGGGIEEEGLTEDNLKKVEAAESAETDNNDEDDDDDEPENPSADGQEQDDSDDDGDGELASILNDSDSDADASTPPASPSRRKAASPPASTTSTALTLIPDALASKFPTLFTARTTPPKLLVTTSLGGTIHREAELLTQLFPNSVYIPRQRQRYQAHHFSLREIAKFATNRAYTALLVLEEDQKRPAGLTIVHLPAGPTFHFALRNWIPGRALPGHGAPTAHHPELVLNGFRTPLGLLTAHLLRSLFPPVPELQGRQAVTLHNQRDYIFVRRHRYVFRDRRPGEKSVTGAGGAAVKGVEDVRVGLQELGPRFTLKLRRVDRGVQRASGQEWEWRARMDKSRTKFQL